MMDQRWHETAIETNVLMQLQDLTTVLSQVDLQLELAYGSFVDVAGNRITVSSLWDSTKSPIQTSGYKTDVYLRALGTIHHSDLRVLDQLENRFEPTHLKNFTNQLFTLLEDLRVENIITRIRPGTTTDFAVRSDHLRDFFSTRLTTSITSGRSLDELFCMIYLVLQSAGPEQSFPRAHQQQLDMLEHVKAHLYESYDARSTGQIVHIVRNIVKKISHIYEHDIDHTYFVFPIFNKETPLREKTLFAELTRTDDVDSEDTAKTDGEDDDYQDETLLTWHQENEQTEHPQTFLQMDLDEGLKTNLADGEARETESGDQAFASAQGMSQKSNQADYSEKEALDDRRETASEPDDHIPYGADNMHAKAIMKQAKPPTEVERLLYDTFVRTIKPYQRKLAQTIEKILEHKRTSKRDHLQVGRLAKNLLPVVTEAHPRLFYKKDDESAEFDAVFTLLVDCSASMYDKMEETKHGIVLFHEVLKSLKIPHMIVGFWEEATIGMDEQQLNYFHTVHSFSDSLYEKNGAKIMQLEPEEDNRDGFSIRVITEQMMKRHEHHKLLLVFSDGEPSAEGYEQNGIIDTHQAVSDARKQGIDVMGMFLSDGTFDEGDEAMMKMIYGNERVMIPEVAELPERFIPILKKLLLKTI